MARGTRFGSGLKDITLKGTNVLESGATLEGLSKATIASTVYGVASGDTTYDGIKLAAGHVAITGSRDIQTGLTTVISGGANLSNKSYEGVKGDPFNASVRISQTAGTQVPATKGDGYMKILIEQATASIEATVAASVDWFAIGV